MSPLDTVAALLPAPGGPTAFRVERVAVPPPGPAIPVTAIATSAPLVFSAPSAIARETASDTAPCCSISEAPTPIMPALASLE